MNLSPAEVISRVRWLESDELLRQMRDRARRRHELHSMLDVPDVPPHMTRGDSVSVNGSDLIWLLNSILADFQSYPTTTTIIPEGKSNQDFVENAETVEKAYAIIRNRLDEGGRNSHDGYWHQGATGWFVKILHCAAASPDNNFPWSVEIPDPLTCFFPVMSAPGRPSMLARRYTMLVSDVINRYGKQKRTPFSGKQLRYEEDEWQWATPLAEDQPVEAGDVGNLSTRRVGLPGVADSVEILEYYDNDEIYHVALNGTIATGVGPGPDDTQRKTGDGLNGQIIFYAKTMTDGIPVVVVPGHTSPLRLPTERYQPTLWPAMQCVMVINLLNAMVMSKEFNWKPDIIVEQSPEMVIALKDAGILQEPTNVALEQAGPNIVNVGGKPMLWNQPPSDQLNKMIEWWTQKLASFIDSALAVTTAEVAKQSTLGGIQLAIGVRKRQQGPWLANHDWGEAEILKMVRASIHHYGREIILYARGSERWAKGEMQQGSMVTISPDILDFPHEIDVSTESMTEEERKMLVDSWAERRALGISTTKEGIQAAGYQDVGAQLEEVAYDLIFQHNTSAWLAQTDQLFADFIRTSGGILLPMGVPPSGQPAPMGGNAPAPGPGTPPVPPTGSVAGGAQPPAGVPV